MKAKSVLVAFLAVMTGYAQNSEKAAPTGYTSLNAGVGIPLGDFASETVGGAYSGGCFHVNFSTPLFKSNFGMTTKIDLGIYEMTTTPFILDQKEKMRDLGLGLQDGVDYKFKPVSSGSYTHNNILIGLYITAPVKRFSFDARFLGGVNFTDRPGSKIDFDFVAGSYKETYYENASNSTSFAYDLGFGVRYNMGKKQKLCLMVSFDFIGAEGNFSYTSKRLYYDQMGNLDDVELQDMDVSYSVSTYNMTLGFGYVFGKKGE